MFISKVLMTAPLMAVLMSGAAQAALTADQVWADWQALGKQGGGTISAATEVKDGGVLRLNGVTMAGPTGGGGVTISDVSLSENADGSVSIRPGEIKLTPSADGTATLASEGLVVTVYDDAGGLGYGVDAPKLDLNFDSKTPAGAQAASGSAAKGSITIEGLNGRFTREAGAAGLRATMTRLAYDIGATDEASGMASHQANDTQNYDLSGTLTIPEGLVLSSVNNPLAFIAAARQGLGLRVDMTIGTSKAEMESRSPAFGFALSGSSEPGEAHLELNKDRALLTAKSGGASYVIRPPTVPSEVKADLGGMEAEFIVPLSAVTTAEPFRYMVKFSNVVLEEAGWALFDPKGALQHGPLDLALDVTGSAKLDALGLMEAKETNTPPQAMPEIESLNIAQLGLTVAGAVLNGSGAFTFDNSGVAAGAPPMPLGSAELHVTGANKLIDGLQALGVLKDQDVQGARMMMGMFGKVEGEDALSTKLEAKEGGQIFVNGQRVK
jgi:hypothetical protein